MQSNFPTLKHLGIRLIILLLFLGLFLTVGTKQLSVGHTLLLYLAFLGGIFLYEENIVMSIYSTSIPLQIIGYTKHPSHCPDDSKQIEEYAIKHQAIGILHPITQDVDGIKLLNAMYNLNKKGISVVLKTLEGNGYSYYTKKNINNKNINNNLKENI